MCRNKKIFFGTELKTCRCTLWRGYKIHRMKREINSIVPTWIRWRFNVYFNQLSVQFSSFQFRKRSFLFDKFVVVAVAFFLLALSLSSAIKCIPNYYYSNTILKKIQIVTIKRRNSRTFSDSSSFVRNIFLYKIVRFTFIIAVWFINFIWTSTLFSVTVICI